MGLILFRSIRPTCQNQDVGTALASLMGWNVGSLVLVLYGIRWRLSGPVHAMKSSKERLGSLGRAFTLAIFEFHQDVGRYHCYQTASVPSRVLFALVRYHYLVSTYKGQICVSAVSYTHLTLPTKRIV